jgi:hypothetical protein
MAQLTDDLVHAQQFDTGRRRAEEQRVVSAMRSCAYSLPVSFERTSASLVAAATWSAWGSGRSGRDCSLGRSRFSSIRTDQPSAAVRFPAYNAERPTPELQIEL